MSDSPSRSMRRRREEARRRQERRRRVRRITLVGGGAVLIVLLVVGGYLGWQASRAKSAIDTATAEASTLQRQITDGSSDEAKKTLERLQEATATARSNTHGGLWSLASHLPVVGDDVTTVQTASESIDDIARRGLPPVVNTASAVSADLFQPRDGRLDLRQFTRLAGPVAEASAVFTRNQERLAAIDANGLVGPLQDPVRELRSKVDDAADAARSASIALRVAPEMLGVDGTRRYALLFQNNAEIRPAGGMPGAMAIIEARRGKVSIVDQYSSSDYGVYASAVLKQTADEKATYGAPLVRDLRDSTLIPDFPRTGQIVRAMVERIDGTEVDGVISIDPVTLSYALKGTGPVELGNGDQLNSDNAVELLLNTVYARYSDPQQQDAYFGNATKRVFDKITDGAGDSRETLRQLTKATDENRVTIWSADKRIEKLLAPTGVGGVMPRSTTRPDIGVYLSDATASKMQYYLDHKTRVSADRCEDGRQTFTVTTTLRSKAPSDAALLPSYITGKGKRGPLGSMRLNVYTFAPVGGRVVSTEINGKVQLMAAAQIYGRPGVQRSMLLGPGKTITIEQVVEGTGKQSGNALLTTTPGIGPSVNDVTIRSAC